MDRKDRDIIESAIQEAMAGAGGMAAVQTVVGHVVRLIQRFGDQTTIEGTIGSLDEVIETSERMKREILAAGGHK